MNGLREPGTILDGKYEIVQRLASGGMGEVYLVRHLHLQELRVVKILRQDLQADPAAQKRFLREARLATQIKHPNIAILYDFSRLEDGSFYMVSEHIEGEDVGDRLRRTGPFSLALAIQLGIQALRGLEAIHASGIIHRDLSPDNLMIMSDRRGQPVLKIIDLGLARTLEADANFEITQVGMFMGKLQYCSPEQAGAASGETLDARSDIYSFGLVLYEMITGFPPFESENQAGFIFKRLSEDPLSLVGRNPQVEVPVEVDRVVRRALERDRERRYPTAIGFIEALEQVVLRMNAAETREIPIWSFPPEARPPETRPPEARRRSSSELSKADRDDLLAQIDRAARRVQESAVNMARVEAALAAGKIEEAERLIAGIEAAQPRAAGLDRARQRLQEMKDVASVHLRVAETEQVLHQYIQRKQLALARLALETLTELRPAHPKRGEYAAAIDLLGKELEQEKRATAALAAGREALARKDLKAARRELDAIARNDPSGKRAASFKEELEAVERDARDQSTADDLRRRLETALAGQRVTDATLARGPGPAGHAAGDAGFLPRADRGDPPRPGGAGAALALRTALPQAHGRTATGSAPARWPRTWGRPCRRARGRPRCSPRRNVWRASTAGTRPWSRGCARSRSSSSRGTPPRPSWPSRSSSRWTPKTGTASAWRSRSGRWRGEILPSHGHSVRGRNPRRRRSRPLRGEAAALCLHEADARLRLALRGDAAHRPGRQVVQRDRQRGDHRAGRPGARAGRRPLLAAPRRRGDPRLLPRSRPRLPGLRLR